MHVRISFDYRCTKIDDLELLSSNFREITRDFAHL